MAQRPVRAITFDLWDCVFIDDSDEPKRAAAGRKPKSEARREVVWEALQHHGTIAREVVDLAYAVTDAAFNKVWHEQYVTWTVRERLEVLLTGLGRALPDPDLDALIACLEGMELEFRPDPVPGVHEAVAALRGQYKLGVISDAIFSPGRTLRELLAGENLLERFDAFVFSDEMGFSKPSPRVFKSAADALGVDPDALVHIGDRPHNDVAGAHAVGARAVLLTVAKQRDAAGFKPDAVCDDYARLPGIIERLNDS